MRVVQIVFSPTGGTQKAADLLTAGWNQPVEQVDLSRPDLEDVRLTEEDVAVIAVPSFGGRVPGLAAQRLGKAQGGGARCILAVVYGNRAYEDTLVELQDLAEEQGFRVIAGVAAVAEHSILHQYATGRPDAQDREELQEFSAKILDKLNRKDSSVPSLPGNRPYKKAGGAAMVPKADDHCVQCGRCARRCPAQAIPLDNPRETDGKKCISCMRCVTECPQSARKVNSVMAAAAALALKKVCSVRKNGELYL